MENYDDFTPDVTLPEDEQHHNPDEFTVIPDHEHTATVRDLRNPNAPNSIRMTFALAGNQNCGKTTLFNYLTGSNQHVGNWPGVTVEHKEGIVRKYPGVTIVDLPGIYSLSPYTDEEVISRNYLIDEKPDGIINIIDATNLERSLYLTLQIAELGIPMVIALNMMDELQHNGDSINIPELEKDLGIPIIPITARSGNGVAELMEKAIEAALQNAVPPLVDICEGEVHKALHSIAHLMEDKANQKHYSPRYVATKLIEDDPLMKTAISLSPRESEIIEGIVRQMEEDTGLDREAAIADSRYQFITRVSAANLKRRRSFGEPTLSNKIDKILTHKYLAIPVFIAVMLLVFWVAFGPIGTAVSDLFTAVIDKGIQAADAGLTVYGISPWVHDLIINGVLAGVGSVLGVLPVILVLFTCLSVLEDCGYISRAAFIMDRALSRLGLTGRSFIPMLMGFGCTVPAVMGARTLDNMKDRRMTVFLTPFMSCSAKVPVYTLFIAAFFTRGRTLIMAAFYLLGFLVAILYGLILRRTIFRGKPAPFIIELPPYRMPTVQNVLRNLWDKAKDFVERAITLILAATVIIWFLQHVDLRFYMVSDNSKSILASVCSLIAPVFRPLGFGNWQSVASLVTGILAKESVLSTMSVLYKAEGTVTGGFSTVTAISFLTFFLLYPPCVASMSVMKREIGRKWTILSIVLQILVAWLGAFAVYHIALLF